MRALVVVGLGLLVPMAAAESLTIAFTAESGPANSGGVNCIGQRGWLLADEAGDGKAYMSATSSGLGCATAFSYTASSAFTTAGSFAIAVLYDCDTPTIIGSSPATSGTRFTLYHNGVSIGTQTNSLFQVCTGSPIADGATLGEAGLEVAAGDTLRLDILWWGTDLTSQTRSLHVVAAQSSIVVPIIPPAPAAQTLYADLDAPSIQHVFANATSDTYVLNFTTNSTAGMADVAVNGTGNVTATLIDANGTALINGTLASGTLEFRNVTAGAWQLTLAYDGFVGNLTFSYHDGMLPLPAPPEPVQIEPDNATATVDEDPAAAESPALPVVGLLAAVGLAAWRRR